jgi:uncharacterized membrane protein
MGRGRQGRTNWPLLLTVGIAVALALRIGSVWAQLPDSMASHFGPSGRPDSFMSKEAFFLVMALIGGGSVASVFASPTLIRHLPPSLANLHRSNLDNGAFMTVLVAYFAFVIAVFVRKMRLLKLPE